MTFSERLLHTASVAKLVTPMSETTIRDAADDACAFYRRGDVRAAAAHVETAAYHMREGGFGTAADHARFASLVTDLRASVAK